MKPKPTAHQIYPWNAMFMYCPEDGLYHKFGCKHARENPDLVPASIRSWWQEVWQSHANDNWLKKEQS